MKLIKISYIFLFFLLCGNKCARDGTSFRFFNNSTSDVVVLSKNEIVDFKNNFLSKEFLNSRIINKKDNIYLGFEDHELNSLKNEMGDYLFFIIVKDSLYKKWSRNRIDSILISSSLVRYNKPENWIIYSKNKISFKNKN